MSQSTALIALASAAAVMTVSTTALSLPITQAGLAAAVVCIGVFIVLSSNKKTVRQAKQSATDAYNELTQSTPNITAAARKHKKNANKAVSQAVASVSQRADKVTAAVSQKADKVKQAVTTAVNENVKPTVEQAKQTATQAVSEGKGSKKQSKKNNSSKPSNSSTSNSGSTANDENASDDDDGTIDIAQLINVQQQGKKDSKQQNAVQPVVQPYVKKQSESEIARIEAQNKLKAEAEAKAKRAAEAKVKQQQEADQMDGWTVSQTQQSGSSTKKSNGADDGTQGSSSSSSVVPQQSKAAEQPTAPSVPSDYTTSEVTVETKHFATIIGTKGATLQALQAGTGAKIQMPGRDANGAIQISGTAQQVQHCTAMINSLTTKGYSSVTHPGTLHTDISVPQEKLGLLIGPGGINIKTIQQKTNTRINLPDRSGNSGKVIIVGGKDDIKTARSAIKQLVQDGFCDLTHEGYSKESIEFPSDKRALLIGPKGHTIKSIQGNTRTKINLPEATEENQNQVSIVGPTEGIQQAIKEIQRLLIPREPVARPGDEFDEDDEEYDADEKSDNY